MDLDASLRARAAEYEAAIDNMIDALHASEDTFAIHGIELVDATTRDARALNAASRESPQEIAEHYLQLARNLHIETPFLIAKLTGYRERRRIQPPVNA